MTSSDNIQATAQQSYQVVFTTVYTELHTNTNTMSDFEDDDMMEVDGPKPSNDDSMTFHALDKKGGKRIAADLPVELEDSLPWYGSIFQA